MMCKRGQMAKSGGCCCCNCGGAATGEKAAIKDPVCGMSVDPATASKFEYKGTTYHFCCKDCLDKFKANPEKFLSKKAEPPAKEKAAPKGD
jgi:Cu+-exporting ATPase